MSMKRSNSLWSSSALPTSTNVVVFAFLLCRKGT
jgi:hypothetical protein